LIKTSTSFPCKAMNKASKRYSGSSQKLRR
jgi:hypothetical protein